MSFLRLLLTVKVIFLLLPVLISVAFLTLMERKVLRLVGVRVGPNKVSLGGFLQPIGDAVKLGNKQVNYLSNFSFFFYYFSRVSMFIMGVLSWFVVFRVPSVVMFKYRALVIFLVLGFNSLNAILRGWSTFGKYPLVGRLRTVSQLISYEAVLYLCLFFFIVLFSRFRFNLASFFCFERLRIARPFLLLAWLVAVLAELNRTPYDFSEGERELVSGFNTDFGSLSFTLIFLAEYRMILFFSFFSALIFFKSTLFFFFFFFFLIWIRSVLPRFRFDKLMMLAWKFLVPFLTFFFVIILSFLFF